MSEKNLHKNLQKDIETLKHLRVGILPVKQYYKEIAKGWGFVYWCLISMLFLGCLFANSINAWPYTPEYKSELYKLQKFGLPRPVPGTVADAVWHRDKEKNLAAKIKSLKEAQRPEHQSLVVQMLLGVLGVSLFLMMFLSGYIKMYVIFKNQISIHLKTGEYIKKKVWQAFSFFIACFALFSLFTVSIFNQDLTFFAGMLSFIFAALVSSFLIDMEFSRIGISPLTNTIANYFSEEDRQLDQNL